MFSKRLWSAWLVTVPGLKLGRGVVLGGNILLTSSPSAVTNVMRVDIW